MSLPEAVISPRFHHQWKPSDLKYELGGISADTRHLLGQMGYVVKYEESHGRMHALERFTNGRVWGVADPRSEGAAVAEAR